MRLPAVAREAGRIDRRAIWRYGIIRSLAEYFGWSRGRRLI